MNRIIEGLAMLAENPLACSAIVTVQIFGAIAALVAALHATSQLLQTRDLREAWPIVPASARRLRSIFDKAVQRSGIRRLPALRVASGDAGACTIGFWRPDVCISADLVAKLDDEELEAVLLHEIAHAARRDTLGASLLLFGAWGAVFVTSAGYVLAERISPETFHLGSTWSRLLITAAIASFVLIRFFVAVPGKFLRELTCDDMAVRASGNPLALAAALIAVSRLQTVRHRNAVATSPFAGEQSFVLYRIRRLLDYEPPWLRLTLQRAVSVLGLLIISAVATVLAR